MLKEFKKFAVQGNIVELAIGIIIGGAFGRIVSSFVEDIIMPLISLLTDGINFTDLFISLDGTEYSTLAQAQEAGAATINYGQFIGIVLDFIIVAFSIFLAIRWLSKLKKNDEIEEEVVKDCIYCKTEIPIGATRCPHCTSQLK